MVAKKSVSIKRRLFIFSVTLFGLILTAGSAAFFVAMRSIIRNSVDHELARTLEIERIKLESSVSGEIELVLKMARSPLIQAYFADPANSELSKIAFTEIHAYRESFKSHSVFWVNDIDRMFYSDDNEPYWVDDANPDNYWYNMTLYKTEVYNFNINYNPDLGVTNLWINAPVFDGARKPVGMLGTGINLSKFTDAIYKGYSGAASIYFFNRLDEITGAKDTELVARKKKLDAALLDAELSRKISAAAKELGRNGTKTISTAAGEISVTAVPTLEWYAFAVRPITPGDYNTYMTVFFVVVLAVIALIFVVFNVYMSAMETNVQRLTKTFAVGDIEVEIPYTQRKDDIDTMSAAIHGMMEKLRAREIKLVQAHTVTAAGLRFDLFIKEAENVPQAFRMTLALLCCQYESVRATLVYASGNDFYALLSHVREDGERVTREANYYPGHAFVMALVAGKRFVFLNAFALKEHKTDFAGADTRIACIIPLTDREEAKGYIMLESADEETLSVTREEEFMRAAARYLSRWLASFEKSRGAAPKTPARTARKDAAPPPAKDAAPPPAAVKENAAIAVPLQKPANLFVGMGGETDTDSGDADDADDSGTGGALAPLREIDGLDLDAALETMGGMEDVYEKSVRLFARLAPETVEKMDGFIDTDLGAFAVEIHGVKGSLNNIGALTLGGKAAEIEAAAKSGGVDVCRERYPRFRESLMEFHGRLVSALPEEDGAGERPAGDKRALPELLRKAEEAAGDFDAYAAAEIMQGMLEFTYGAETDSLIREAIALLERYDCENAAVIIQKLITGVGGR